MILFYFINCLNNRVKQQQQRSLIYSLNKIFNKEENYFLRMKKLITISICKTSKDKVLYVTNKVTERSIYLLSSNQKITIAKHSGVGTGGGGLRHNQKSFFLIFVQTRSSRAKFSFRTRPQSPVFVFCSNQIKLHSYSFGGQDIRSEKTQETIAVHRKIVGVDRRIFVV